MLCHQSPYYFALCFCHTLTALSSPSLSSPSFPHASPDHPRLSFSLLECELSEAGPDTVLVTLLLQCHRVHNHAQKSKVNVELASLPLPFSVAKSLFMPLNMLASLALCPSIYGTAMSPQSTRFWHSVVARTTHIADVPGLAQCFSECGPWASSITTSLEGRKANQKLWNWDLKISG